MRDKLRSFLRSSRPFLQSMASETCIPVGVEPINLPAWLRAHPPQACAAAQVSRPVQLGGWEKRSEDDYHYADNAGPPPLALPPLPCDLNQGLDNFVPKAGGTKAGVEIVIRAVLAAGTPLSGCDILTFRNNLNKLLNTAHDPKSSWAVDGCLVGGTLFLDIVHQVQEEWASGAEQAKFVAWGYNFEALCTGKPLADANTEYGALLRTRIGPHRLFLGAEIDCFDPRAPGIASGAPPLSSFRELKTYRQPRFPGQWRTLYLHKHPKWWVQSYLAGVEALVLGARDEEGVIRKIDVVPTADLPRVSWQQGARWSPEQTLAFGVHCLEWMRSAAAQHAGQHLRFSFAAATGLISAQLLQDGDLPDRLAAVLPPAPQS